MKLRSGGGAALSSVGHHAEILRGGPEAWNAWRKKRPSTIPHLTGIVLAASERELGGTRGAPINLKSARLQEAVFRFATLSAANLQAADLAHADLVHARLTDANLSEATLQGAALDHADFSGAILRHADLRGASLRFATLTGADLQGADLSGADLAHARLAHCNLAGANLRGAVLDYADFAGADLSEADLSGARLHNVRNLLTPQLEESLGDAATILPSHLRGCVPWSAVGDEPDSPPPRPRRILAEPSAARSTQANVLRPNDAGRGRSCGGRRRSNRSRHRDGARHAASRPGRGTEKCRANSVRAACDRRASVGRQHAKRDGTRSGGPSPEPRDDHGGPGQACRACPIRNR